MRKHEGPPSRHDKQSRWRRSALPVLPRGALLGATSQVYRDVSRLPSSRAEPLPFRHRGDARGNHGAPLHDPVHLPTYLLSTSYPSPLIGSCRVAPSLLSLASLDRGRPFTDSLSTACED